MNEDRRPFYLIRTFSEACYQRKIERIEKLNIPGKFKNINEVDFQSLHDKLSTSQSAREFRTRILDQMLIDLCKTCEDDNEVLFFAAASFDLTRLTQTIEKMKKSSSFWGDINHKRYSDSVIVFVLKYGNIMHDSLYKCMKILVEAGVSVNKFDIKGKFAIDHVASFYETHKKNTKLADSFKKIGELFVEQLICEPDEVKTKRFVEKTVDVDVTTYMYRHMDDLDKLFYLITKFKRDDFLAFKEIRKYVDHDDGENTLLQFASKHRADAFPFVKHLLENKANPNLTTKYNLLTPLELAALNNHQRIFEEILKHKDTEIKAEHFNNFVRWRSKPMNQQLFEDLLESDKLNPHFKHDYTESTPLHYAVWFANIPAINNLLNHGASLIEKNKFGKCILDIINPSDLEQYFDSCVAFDKNPANCFNSRNYKVTLNFNCFMDNKTQDEMRIISKMSKRSHLDFLLIHPIAQVFLELKWFKMNFYFWAVLLLQTLLLLPMAAFFYFITYSTEMFVSCIFLATINGLIKLLWVGLTIKLVYKDSLLAVMRRLSFHEFFEILLILTTTLSLFNYKIRAFLFTEVAICLLLTAGYHPKLSSWSHMLQKVFKTFTVLLLFFSVIMLGFSVGFHIIVDNEIFNNFLKAFGKIFIMTAGEISMLDDTLNSSQTVGYFLYVIFALSMCLVIVNFWTGVAITDIEKIRENSKVNAFKNTILFVSFIDYLYNLKYFNVALKHISSPSLLKNNINGKVKQSNNKSSHIHEYSLVHSETETETTRSIYKVQFFINKEKQFEKRPNFPNQISTECANTIKFHYNKVNQKSTTEKLLLGYMEKIWKKLNEHDSKLKMNDVEK